MNKLTFLSGHLQGATAELIGEEIPIGSSADNAICIDDDSVSAHHAVITRQGGHVVLRDLRSINGTFVDGNRILVATLKRHHRIVFGGVETEYTATEISPLQPASAPNGDSPASSRVLLYALSTVVALLFICGGGYFAYTKLSQGGNNNDLPAPSSVKATPLSSLSKPNPPSAATQLVQSPPPVYATSASDVPVASTPAPPVITPQPATVPASTPSSLPPNKPNTTTATASSTHPASVPAVPGAPQGTPSATTSPQNDTVLVPTSMTLPVPTPPAPVPENLDIESMKPTDWVASLPPQAQNSYIQASSLQDGTPRIEGVRHWLSLWSKALRDPHLSLVELDYLKYAIQYRDSWINKALEEARKNRDRMSKSEWGDIQQSVSRKLSDLTSAENKLTAMRIRSGKDSRLMTMISAHVDLAAKERSDMREINEHYKAICHRHHWSYSWYYYW